MLRVGGPGGLGHLCRHGRRGAMSPFGARRWHPALLSDCGSYGLFTIVGIAGFMPSTVGVSIESQSLY